MQNLSFSSIAIDRAQITQKILAGIAVLLLLQFYLYWKHFAQLSDGKTSLEIEVFELNKRRDGLRQEIVELERDQFRLKSRINGFEQHFDALKLTGLRKRFDERVLIFFVTPTYRRPAQKADLVRLAQTLYYVKDLFWIIVEDEAEPSEFIDDLLRVRSFSRAVHITSQTPPKYKRKQSEPDWKYPKGIAQRNTALEWIRTNFAGLKRGVIYFGDDDNTYDWRLFDEMRTLKRIGVWPVGLVGEALVETPILADNLSVIGFSAVWNPKRPFPLDMASFALNISLLVHQYPTAQFTYSAPRGYQESIFLQLLNISIGDLEPKAEFCSRVYVWHTKTPRPVLTPKQRLRFFHNSNETAAELSALEIEAVGAAGGTSISNSD